MGLYIPISAALAINFFIVASGESQQTQNFL